MQEKYGTHLITNLSTARFFLLFVLLHAQKNVQMHAMAITHTRYMHRHTLIKNWLMCKQDNKHAWLRLLPPRPFFFYFRGSSLTNKLNMHCCQVLSHWLRLHHMMVHVHSHMYRSKSLEKHINHLPG